MNDTPFSFTYDGVASSVLLPTWEYLEDTSSRGEGGIRSRRWRDPKTGLEVRATITTFPDFPATDWILHFMNTGTGDTPILEDIWVLDDMLGTNPASIPVILRQIGGSNSTEHDFIPSEKVVIPGEKVVFAPNGGRSSDTVFPCFNLEFQETGVIVAIGWSGQWKTELRRDDQGAVFARAGMELTRLRLHPGEGMRTPSIMLLRWLGGDWIDGQNQFRRLLLAHYLPRLEGQPISCAITVQSFNSWLRWLEGGCPEWCTEAGQIAAARINHELGCDTHWMDAGWFVGDFPHGVGNWTPKPEAFPRGLKPVAEASHALGLKWLVWWEPERVAADTRIRREHPEFLLEGPTAYEKPQGLFDLGKPEALAWMKKMLDEQIGEFAVDCFRNDFNIDPLPFWRRQDQANPNRQGMAEIRYIEGLYDLWDTIREKHPGLWIDNCAAGGRRIDLETLKRGLVQTRSDTAVMPGRADWDQSQAYGLSLYIPCHATIGWEADTYSMRSSATSGYMGEWNLFCPNFPMKEVRVGIAEIKENRQYWNGDFYPLTPWTLSSQQWMAYQLHCPEGEEGMVLAFRRAAARQQSLVVMLRGLGKRAVYQVTFIDDERRQTSREMNSQELAQLQLCLENPRSSLLIRYRALESNSNRGHLS